MVNREKSDFAVSSFSVLENQLVDCMEYLPFIDENSHAISPKFVPIIIDACGLIDSIFYEISSDKNTEHFNLRKYSRIHESSLELHSNATLFLASPIRLLQPYQEWTKEQPRWWAAYNSLKHDRLNNFHFATFTNAVQALAGLHQLMARQRAFIGSFLKIGWIDTTSGDVLESLGSAAYVGTGIDTVIESRLFASSSSENFVNPDESDEFHFEVNYEANGLSNRVRNILFGHEESW